VVFVDNVGHLHIYSSSIVSQDTSPMLDFW